MLENGCWQILKMKLSPKIVVDLVYKWRVILINLMSEKSHKIFRYQQCAFKKYQYNMQCIFWDFFRAHNYWLQNDCIPSRSYVASTMLKTCNTPHALMTFEGWWTLFIKSKCTVQNLYYYSFLTKLVRIVLPVSGTIYLCDIPISRLRSFFVEACQNNELKTVFRIKR